MVHLILSAIFFHRPSKQFVPTTHSAHRPNFLWSSSTYRRQSSHSPTALLFAVLSASNTVELPRLLPSSRPKMIKGMTRTPPLSTALTPTPISPPRARNNLPIGAPPATSFERCRVTIYASLPPSGTISENPDDLLSLSSSCHDDLPSLGVATPPQGHESTMDR
jgi:hypothetical protein